MMLTQFCEQLDLAASVLLSCWSSGFKQDGIAAGAVPCQEQLCPAIPCLESREAQLGASSGSPCLPARLPGSLCCAVTAALRDPHHRLCPGHIPAAWGLVASSSGTGLTAPRETFPVPPNRIREQGCACGISRKAQCQVGKGECLRKPQASQAGTVV